MTDSVLALRERDLYRFLLQQQSLVFIIDLRNSYRGLTVHETT